MQYNDIQKHIIQNTTLVTNTNVSMTSSTKPIEDGTDGFRNLPHYFVIPGNTEVISGDSQLVDIKKYINITLFIDVSNDIDSFNALNKVDDHEKELIELLALSDFGLNNNTTIFYEGSEPIIYENNQIYAHTFQFSFIDCYNN